jgi:heat shock protein 4
MLLSNLKKIAVMDHGSEVEDCVIGVPVDWTEEQRKILMDGADLAGLKCLSLLNENTATALVCTFMGEFLALPLTRIDMT